MNSAPVPFLFINGKPNATRFSQTIHLPSLKGLYARAQRHHLAWCSEVEQLQTRLDLEVPTDATELENLNAQIDALQADLNTAQGKLEVNLRLQPLARHWEELEQARHSVDLELEQTRLNLEKAGQQELHRERIETLSLVLPVLREIQGLHQKLSGSEVKVRKLTARIDCWQQQVLSAHQDKGLLYWQLQLAREAQGRHKKMREAANETLVRLSTHIHDINEWERLGDELKLLDAQLDTYDPALDGRVALLTSEIEAGRKLEAVQPTLIRLCTARNAWRTAQRQLKLLRRQWDEEEAILTVSCAHAERIEVQLQAAAEVVGRERRTQSHAEIIQEAIQDALEGFCGSDTSGDALCLHCGHALSDEDHALEKARMKRACEAADEALAQATSSVAAAESLYKVVLQARDEAFVACVSRREALLVTAEKIRLAERESELQAQMAHQAFCDLPEAFAEQVSAARREALSISKRGIPIELASAYPNDKTLREIERCLHLQSQKHQLLARLRDQVRLRDVIYERRLPASRRWGELTARYSATAETIRQEYQRALAEVRNTVQTLTDLTLQIRFMKQGWKKAERIWNESSKALRAAQLQIVNEGRSQQAMNLEIEHLIASLPPGWQKDGHRFELKWLRELEAEKERLEASFTYATVAQRKAWRLALKTLEIGAAELDAALEAVPLEARRSIQDFRSDEVKVRQEISTCTERLEHFRKRYDALMVQHERYHELEAQMEIATRNVHLSATLTSELHPDALCSWLLQTASVGLYEAGKLL